MSFPIRIPVDQAVCGLLREESECWWDTTHAYLTFFPYYPRNSGPFWKFILPRDIGLVFRFMRFLRLHPNDHLISIGNELSRGIGWPLNDLLGPHFRDAIIEKPADLTSWMAYADWLQEQDHPYGFRIAAWIRP